MCVCVWRPHLLGSYLCLHVQHANVFTCKLVDLLLVLKANVYILQVVCVERSIGHVTAAGTYLNGGCWTCHDPRG